MENHRLIGDDPMDFINQNVQQTYPDTCAIKSQQLILEDFGLNISEDQLVQEALNQGIYHPGGGTLPQDVGKLLVDHGIPVEMTESANIFDLTRALAEGHKVIIGVDSGELWTNGPLEAIEDFFTEGADHALIVAGIDVTNNEVILTDPGTGQEGARYPLDEFLDAWQDSGNFMVETAVSAPQEYCPEMTGFDYSTGHITNIGHIPYEYFEQTLLPINEELSLDFTYQEDFFNDFHNMLSGDQNSLSPGFIEELNETSLFDDQNLDLTQSFESYSDDMLDDDMMDII